MDIQLKRGLLDVCVLAAIKGKDSYGYQIIKDMKPYLELSESTLYTILKRLETAEMLNEKLERSERERKRDQKLLYESVYLPKIRRRYFRYKLKSVFSWGKKRKKYKRMKKALKEEIRTIGKMLDGGLV